MHQFGYHEVTRDIEKCGMRQVESREYTARSVLYYRVYIAGREVKLSIQDFHLYIQNMPCEHPFVRQLTRSNSGHTHIAPVATFFVY